MKTIKSQQNTPSFKGIKVIMLIFFILLFTPLTYFVSNVFTGNEQIFFINGAK